MNEQTNKQRNEQTNERKSPCNLQDIVPFGAAAQKILDNNAHFEENVEFGHLRPFLAYFWPVLAPVSVFKSPNGYILPSFWWNE